MLTASKQTVIKVLKITSVAWSSIIVQFQLYAHICYTVSKTKLLFIAFACHHEIYQYSTFRESSIQCNTFPML